MESGQTSLVGSEQTSREESAQRRYLFEGECARISPDRGEHGCSGEHRSRGRPPKVPVERLAPESLAEVTRLGLVAPPRSVRALPAPCRTDLERPTAMWVVDVEAWAGWPSYLEPQRQRARNDPSAKCVNRPIGKPEKDVEPAPCTP